MAAMLANSLTLVRTAVQQRGKLGEWQRLADPMQVVSGDVLIRR
jgi:hypothetical protein